MNPRTIVITGATKGLGRELALAAARGGHRVLGLYASDDSAAESLRREIGQGHSIVKHDVTSADDSVWSHELIKSAGRLALINNAWCSFSPAPFHLLRWEDFERGLDVGVKGSWRCISGLLRPMVRGGGGDIVQVLTTAVQGLPPKGFGAYAAAKHAARGLMLSVAAEYSAKGIRAFSVSPSFMQTEMTAGWDARLLESVAASGAATDPCEAAGRTLQLICDEATPGMGEDYPV